MMCHDFIPDPESFECGGITYKSRPYQFYSDEDLEDILEICDEDPEVVDAVLDEMVLRKKGPEFILPEKVTIRVIL